MRAARLKCQQTIPRGTEDAAGEAFVKHHIVTNGDGVAGNFQLLFIELLRHKRVLAYIQQVPGHVFHVRRRLKQVLGLSTVETADLNRRVHSCARSRVPREKKEVLAIGKKFRITMGGLAYFELGDLALRSAGRGHRVNSTESCRRE